jgi:hypothetical protein
LLVAGALWDPTAWQGWLLVPAFVFARIAGKMIGAFAAKAAGPAELPDAGTLGLALSPQSPIAIATIVSYATLYKPADGPGSMPWLMTACIGGAVLTELTVQLVVRVRGGLAFSDLRNPSLASMTPAAPPAALAVEVPAPPALPRFPTEPGP